MEKTLVLIKPDAVSRGLCGSVLSRFEQRGLKILALKMLHLSQKQAQDHYAEHKSKAFFADLVEFITSGPLVAMVLSGENAIKLVRSMMGPTNPAEASPGTIRGDFAVNVRYNVVHGSDGPESADREIKRFFSENEIYQ
jgi:nucleoside-diphosphate kinase